MTFNRIIRSSIVIAIAFIAAPAMAAPVQQSPIGRWITEDGSAVVAIDPCGTALCGRVAKVLRRDPSAMSTDVNNPDPQLRSRPTESIIILSGFVREGERWQGQVYDPRSGRTYRSFLQTKDGETLHVSGCVLLICQSQAWKRKNAECQR